MIEEEKLNIDLEDKKTNNIILELDTNLIHM